MSRKLFLALSIISSACLFTSCGSTGTNENGGANRDSTVRQVRKMPERTALSYVAVSGKDSSLKAYSGKELDAILFLNRCDAAALKKKDTVIVPTQFAGDIIHYTPFPFHVDMLKEVKKIDLYS